VIYDELQYKLLFSILLLQWQNSVIICVRLHLSNRSLANEVVQPSATERFRGKKLQTGPVTIARTRIAIHETIVKSFGSSLASAMSVKEHFWTGSVSCRKNRTAVCRRSVSSCFYARKLDDTLLFWQQRWQVVLACECVLVSRKIENLVGRPGCNTM